MQKDTFQPMSVIKKLDAMRESIRGKQEFLDEKFIDGVKFALVWARVEVLEMAFSKDRFLEKEGEVDGREC